MGDKDQEKVGTLRTYNEVPQCIGPPRNTLAHRSIHLHAVLLDESVAAAVAVSVSEANTIRTS